MSTLDIIILSFAGIIIFLIFFYYITSHKKPDKNSDKNPDRGLYNESAAELGTVPPELMGNFSIIFYQSAEDAVFKALGVD